MFIDKIKEIETLIEKSGKAEKSEDLDMVKRYYGYSNAKARSALKVLTAQQLDYIRERLNTGG